MAHVPQQPTTILQVQQRLSQIQVSKWFAALEVHSNVNPTSFKTNITFNSDEIELRMKGNARFHANDQGLTVHNWIQKYGQAETHEFYVSAPNSLAKKAKGTSLSIELYIDMEKICGKEVGGYWRRFSVRWSPFGGPTKYLTAEIIRLARMQLFVKQFFACAKHEGGEVAGISHQIILDPLAVPKEGNEDNKQMVEDETAPVLDSVYLVEPRQTTTTVIKFSRMLEVSNANNKRRLH
ncbi:hypothetical protein IMY05_C4907000500 [Salix suchowensis]|nr:hypothetical protein IMY05_C4907000500 [Salix suchowensis]